jgi:hypothetical protein
MLPEHQGQNARCTAVVTGYYHHKDAHFILYHRRRPAAHNRLDLDAQVETGLSAAHALHVGCASTARSLVDAGASVKVADVQGA